MKDAFCFDHDCFEMWKRGDPKIIISKISQGSFVIGVYRCNEV